MEHLAPINDSIAYFIEGGGYIDTAYLPNYEEAARYLVRKGNLSYPTRCE